MPRSTFPTGHNPVYLGSEWYSMNPMYKCSKYLRLARDAWSMVMRLRQVTIEYALPPRHVSHDRNAWFVSILCRWRHYLPVGIYMVRPYLRPRPFAGKRLCSILFWQQSGGSYRYMRFVAPLLFSQDTLTSVNRSSALYVQSKSYLVIRTWERTNIVAIKSLGYPSS